MKQESKEPQSLLAFAEAVYELRQCTVELLGGGRDYRILS